MKNTLLTICVAVASLVASPLSMNGALHLNGVQLTNEYDQPVQLRGMSSHGLGWHADCATEESLDALVADWGIDLFRAAMYTEGYNSYGDNPASWKVTMDELVNWTEARGIYVILDWHILSDGDPNTNIVGARDFFSYMSEKHGSKKHIIYEIANEPNFVGWTSIKSYAEDIIPRIRVNDPDNIIIVGTPDYSRSLGSPAANPLTGTNAYNVMYAFHFYGGSHFDQNTFANYLPQLPIFVSEWGTSNYTGNGGENTANSQTWLDLFRNNSAGVSISWANWSYADKDETSAALAVGACTSKEWNNTTSSGAFVKANLLSPADNFVGGTNGPFSVTLTPGVGGSIELVPNQTEYAEGTQVTARAIPDPGYTFTSWGGSASGSAQEVVLNMIDHRSLTADFVLQGELVVNGDFSAGTTGWWVLRTSDGAAASGVVSGGVYETLINTVGTSWESIKLTQSGISLIQGTPYILRFDAWADAPTQISLNLARNASPFDSYLADFPTFGLGTELQTFEYEFTMNAVTDLTAKLEIFSGLTDSTKWNLDNVSLRTPLGLPAVVLSGKNEPTLPKILNQNGSWVFSLNAQDKVSRWSLRDLNGRVVFLQKNPSPGLQLLPSGLSGIYLLDLHRPMGRSSVLVPMVN